MIDRRTVMKGMVGFVAAAIHARARGAAAATPDYASTGARILTYPPVRDGYYFPAEWARHERALMQFLPAASWYPKTADREWAAVANAVAEFEPVTMAVLPSSVKRARQLLTSAIELIEWPMNDGWCRDSGPMILVNGTKERRVAGFEFNGWGAKYPPFSDDALIKARFARHLNMALHPVDMVLEGGAVHVDGESTLITTAECLLNKNRNPDKSREKVESLLKQWLGVRKVIWLPRGLTPDPITDGHVDGMAAFAAPAVVLLHTTDDRSDPNYEITMTAKKILRETPDARGRSIEVIELPVTSWDVLHMNFYICNGGIIVPVVGKAEKDDAPLAILREAFPRHQVVAVTGRSMAKGGGGVHCITQQVPAARK
jgi:agmatine deiminase